MSSKLDTKIKILHLCNDFSKQAIYKSLFEEISKVGIDQDVYVSIRDKSEKNKNSSDSFNTFYDFILRPYDRIFFNNKIKKIFNSLIEETYFLQSAKLVHAHCFYSDGAVALKIKNKFNIDYIVAIRNTDINYFMKYRPDLKRHAIKIALESRAMIFLNHGYKDRFICSMPQDIQSDLFSKSIVIPNGLHESWFLDNSNLPNIQDKANIKVLYVGDFSKNKNVKKLIKGIRNLNSNNIPTLLTIVGGGEDRKKSTEKEIKKFSKFCNYVGRIDNQDELKKIFRSHHVLAMPSRYETFGMVFIEALSQGCQLLYTSGEAISGLINDKNIAIGIKNHTSVEIADSILKLFRSRPSSRSTIALKADDFRLTKIVNQYKSLYEQCIKKI